MKKKKTVKSGLKKNPGSPPANAAAQHAGAVKAVITAAAVVFIIFNLVEIAYFLNKQHVKGPVEKSAKASANKGAELLYSWQHNFKKGCTSIGEYGNYLYAVDDTRGDIYITDKKTGAIIKYLNYAEGVKTALEAPDGFVYVLLNNGNVLKVKKGDYKTARAFSPKQGKYNAWMDVDSENNFYIAGAGPSSVMKYDSNFVKLYELGKSAQEKAVLSNVQKIFTGPDDSLYALNLKADGMKEVIIYSKTGDYITSWPLKGMKSFSGMNNLAITPGGYIYINEMHASLIHIYNSKGKRIGGFNGSADGRFQIVYATSLTGGKNGVIYVYTHKVAAFKALN